MELVKSKETTKLPSDSGRPLDSHPGGPRSPRIEDSMVGPHDESVEHAWLLKSEMQWVREDRNPVNALRWLVWDRLSVGHPPSRVTKRHPG